MKIGQKIVGIMCMLWLMAVSACAQSASATRVDVFAGVDFNYRDIYHNKVYELLINLTPGVKWHLGNHWQLAGQVLVPVVNDYGDRYKKVRLNMAVLSKEFHWNQRHYLKVSGGLFGLERYGLDVKWMCPVTDWLLLDAQAGWTGYCSMAVDWECSPMERVTALAGVRTYLKKVNTEFRVRGGRYVYEDYGVQGEAMRHFKHCTVGVYAKYSDVAKESYGFRVTMMIPPYQRSNRKVRFRPASNFLLSYNSAADPYGVKMYNTDPEENDREGWFDRKALNWGANTMAPDFSIKEGGVK